MYGMNEGIGKLVFDREELVEKIESARDSHVKDLAVKFSEYGGVVVDALRKAEALIGTDEFDEKAVKAMMKSLSKVLYKAPQCHVKEFEQLLPALRASVGKTVELTQDAYNRYVRNDWTGPFDGELGSYTSIGAVGQMMGQTKDDPEKEETEAQNQR